MIHHMIDFIFAILSIIYLGEDKIVQMLSLNILKFFRLCRGNITERLRKSSVMNPDNSETQRLFFASKEYAPPKSPFNPLPIFHIVFRHFSNRVCIWMSDISVFQLSNISSVMAGLPSLPLNPWRSWTKVIFHSFSVIVSFFIEFSLVRF